MILDTAFTPSPFPSSAEQFPDYTVIKMLEEHSLLQLRDQTSLPLIVVAKRTAAGGLSAHYN